VRRRRDVLHAALSDQVMKTIERWVLRISDSDWTWYGFGWMRPAKHQRLGLPYLLFSSVLLGLPGIVVGIGALFLVFGKVELQVCGWIFAAVVLVELLLHLVFAHYWNGRATMVARVNAAPDALK
jgi:hypothetical protein